MAVCKNCGTSVPYDARFCSTCGQPMAETVDQPAVTEAEPMPIAQEVTAQVTAEPMPEHSVETQEAERVQAIETEPQQEPAMSGTAPQGYYAEPQNQAPEQSYYTQGQPDNQQSYYAQPEQPNGQQSYYAQAGQPNGQQSYYAQPGQPNSQQSYYAQAGQPNSQQSYYAQAGQANGQQSYYAQPGQPNGQQSYYAQQGQPNNQQNYYAQGQQGGPNNYGYQPYQQPYTSGPADIEENKGICVLCYLGILLLIPLLTKPNSAYVKYHSNQGLVLLIFSILVGILAMIPYLGWFIIAPVGYIFSLVCIIMGIVNAVNGQMKPLPLIGKISLIK